VVGEVVGPAKAFSAGLAAVLAQVHLLVLTQAVLPAELHPAFNALEQLKQKDSSFVLLLARCTFSS
jgi:hypothetical protein